MVVCVCIVVFVVFCCLGVVCVSGGRLKYLLETSVVNMSNKKVIRLYLCRFSLVIALEKCVIPNRDNLKLLGLLC